ncbi:class I SAM-dependent methyltransferase [Litoribaculum gwangyangense]|uniref:Class I SAM-dependent methyltransferase n=1 Tax=Litoribaculum gwangyangense TaxID=1130722 RepID=A0ABP9CGW2_9FLAO
MNYSILNTEIQEFINNNLNSNIASILLKGTSFNSIETKEIIEQIESKKRCEKKLPTWFGAKNIYYPNKLNIEQTSSEITAKYKSELIKGASIIDLTGGFGVDCFYFAKQFKRVIHCEIDDNISNIVAHNFSELNMTNIQTINNNGIEYLKTNSTPYDWIYIDPSRRHDTKGKVFFLKDCEPNVPEHLELLFKNSEKIMIKTSPLLDISMGINELKFVKTIHVIAVHNEVKELLWILESGFDGIINVETVNLKNENKERFRFNLNEERNTEACYSLPLNFLYEPNAAILKSGAFNEISNQMAVFKIHKHSHLYTSDILMDFPGRRFKIENIIPYNKKDIKKLNLSKANITTRNFPETVQEIRKKFHIQDGGETYMFFTTDLNNQRIVIITQKLD